MDVKQLTKQIQAKQTEHAKLAQQFYVLQQQQRTTERQIEDTQRDIDFITGEANGLQKMLELLKQEPQDVPASIEEPTGETHEHN